jgi:hypothetical protein
MLTLVFFPVLSILSAAQSLVTSFDSLPSEAQASISEARARAEGFNLQRPCVASLPVVT